MNDSARDKAVLTNVAGGVLTITLNRPDDNNRIDRHAQAAIVAAVEQADRDE